MRGEVGKETSKKEMDFYDVLRDILGFPSIKKEDVIIKLALVVVNKINLWPNFELH